MPITINGSGTIAGISVGGLENGCVNEADLATAAVSNAKLSAAAVTPDKMSQPLTLDTAKASTSGTFIDFTGIPSWVKRVTVMLRGVSSSGTSNFLLQLGTSGGFTTTGYVGAVNREVNILGFSTGFQLMFNTSAAITNEIPVSLINVSGNTWMASFVSARSDNGVSYGAGSVTLSGTLTQLRITTVNGTDTFDAGSINIMYE